MLGRWLSHPLTRDLDLDDPRTTLLRQDVLRQKRFLRRIYEEWYAALAAELPDLPGGVLEIGSGAGFLAELVPGLITSELVPLSGLRCALDAGALPFADAALRAIVGTNVLHHLERPRAFLAEAARALPAGGVVALIEPWVTRWSRLVYARVGHEPFAPEAAEWEQPAGGPLSGANGALPWILFCRDRRQFEGEFPAWQIRSVQPIMPLRYLLSGGLSLRLSMPAWSSGAWKLAETWLERWAGHTAMFAKIVLEKRPNRD
ncbi:MAG TPA: methyltransferase domain-containing protein [Thermoanaerobaculia bacterium]|nr:methyltransferase domain-containing protein [Thermoanaerobaculia bacterium]